jgi:glycosyltransferase involved in cell wall biosynthesis
VDLSQGGISAVLPAYNEEQALAATVKDLRAVLQRVGRPFEILIVNDGSRDGTGALADRLAAEDVAVRALHHAVNRGYGGALKTGFDSARGEWVFLMDADGQFDPAELPAFVAATSRADFIVGYRHPRADPGHRTLFAKTWAALTSVLLGVGVRDVDCAFKLMRRSYVSSLALEAHGAFLSAEMLGKARRIGARFEELPVRHLPRRTGTSTGGRLDVLLRALYEMVRLGWRVRRFRPKAPVVPPSPVPRVD